MSQITAAFLLANPHYMMPEILLQMQQASGAFDTLATGQPMVRLGEGDLWAYVKRLDIRTKVAGSQAAYNQLPSVSLSARMGSTPAYLYRVRSEYDHHDQGAAGRWGFGLPEAYRLGTRQAIFQQLRNALLYGVNPANGEGLLSSQGATTVNLPADSNGNTTVLTYDNGQMAVFLLQQVANLKTRTLQLGIGRTIVVCGPQRVLGQFEYPNIVQLTQFQREGGGTNTTAGVLKDLLSKNEDKLLWLYDDTLIGQGAGGNDAIIMTMPEIVTPVGRPINTNEWARLQPNLDANNVMLCDMAAPREIPTPLPGGAIDVLSELRATSGWNLRPEALTIMSMQYS